MRYSFFLLIIFISGQLSAQKLKKEDKLLIDNLRKHVLFLSDDRLEGRRTGSKGEATAASYIAEQFRLYGLQSKSEDGYLQTFPIDEGREYVSGTSLTFNSTALTPGTDYFPLSVSPDMRFEGSPSAALQEPGMPWFYDLKDILEEEANNPHFDLGEAVANSAKKIAQRGGTMVFIYNTSSRQDGLKFDARDRASTLPVPVIYLSRNTVTKYLSDASASIDIKLKLSIKPVMRSGVNVVGYIDNGAKNTIIIGAHYDHLGLGEDGNSREVEHKGQIHNGADDNASGTSAMLELARMIHEARIRSSNFAFIAFSGEELGLFGSKYFTSHPTVDLANVNFMVNLDMVGRLNDSTHVLTVGGYGTTPLWGQLYSMKGKKSLYAKDLSFRFDSSGTGPSDHTSFYVRNIPVLFYFTGLHPDYHKPTDDYEKINFNGMLQVEKHIYSLIETVARREDKLVFMKTREAQTTTSARFSVTLGIMPDYSFSGAGVRADGVSDNRPAQKAGLKAGDVIVSIGDRKITSLENYMQALGSFKKGDKAKLVYQRGSELITTTVEF